jgi:Ras-related protein Rab-8A
MTEKNYDHCFKLITLGNSGVGKTSMILRYCESIFSPTFITSIGVDFKVKNLVQNGKRVKLNIWDTAGQERFRNITMSYIRGSNGILMVYDISDRKSYLAVNEWMRSISENTNTKTNIILIANKCDREMERQVTKTEGEMLAKQYKIPFYEVSARKNINIEEALRELVGQCLANIVEKPVGGAIKIDEPVVTKEKKCC